MSASEPLQGYLASEPLQGYLAHNKQPSQEVMLKRGTLEWWAIARGSAYQPYRGTSVIRNSASLEPYSRKTLRALRRP